MTKRIAAALLWFYSTWCAWTLIVVLTGWTPFIGPVIATAVSAFIAGDPMHRVWGPRVSNERINNRLASLRSA